MSAVKRNLKNTKLIKKCQIIRQIEKGMTNKEASEKFGVPKNTISTWMKNKNKLFEGLEQSSSDAKKMRRCDYEQVDKAVFKWFSLQRSQNIPLMGQYSEKRCFNLQKVLIFLPLKLQMDGWISGKKGETNIFCEIKCSL